MKKKGTELIITCIFIAHPNVQETTLGEVNTNKEQTCNLPQTRHLVHPTQSMIRVIFL